MLPSGHHGLPVWTFDVRHCEVKLDLLLHLAPMIVVDRFTPAGLNRDFFFFFCKDPKPNRRVPLLHHNETGALQGDELYTQTSRVCPVGSAAGESRSAPGLALVNEASEQWSWMALDVFLKLLQGLRVTGPSQRGFPTRAWLLALAGHGGHVQTCRSFLRLKDQPPLCPLPHSSLIVFMAVGIDGWL